MSTKKAARWLRTFRVGISARLDRREILRTIGEVQRGFIEAAVLEQGYHASEVASFLGRHPSNVSRALQKREGKL